MKTSSCCDDSVSRLQAGPHHLGHACPFQERRHLWKQDFHSERPPGENPARPPRGDRHAGPRRSQKVMKERHYKQLGF